MRRGSSAPPPAASFFAKRYAVSPPPPAAGLKGLKRLLARCTRPFQSLVLAGGGPPLCDDVVGHEDGGRGEGCWDGRKNPNPRRCRSGPPRAHGGANGEGLKVGADRVTTAPRQSGLSVMAARRRPLPPGRIGRPMCTPVGAPRVVAIDLAAGAVFSVALHSLVSNTKGSSSLAKL